ncbi:dihydrofolate reductase family protein [Labilibaculum sp. DW002]|uniref:Dihydrofolate reductase family protein n=1 Tax=Paralabilibaculum antarcticum TaxID=2912572 RepID=A0ABT5VYW1_9BACT|nr:dihydrofolate reductase family protein [Labilibaculum sp. DW002]MDE5420497.1 dihydrofolate reductase family protein [Labilibaculum sp. DW002]
MRKVKLYIAMSLNGKIARKGGEVDWLEAIPNPAQTDYGYEAFYNSIDTTIMGKKTYDQIMSWGIDFPYAGKKNFVFTSQTDEKNTEHVRFLTENQVETIKTLKNQEGKDIWLIGGGKINSLLIEENLIDEIIIFVMPIILPNGIALFDTFLTDKAINLKATKSHSSGVVELKYELNQ